MSNGKRRREAMAERMGEVAIHVIELSAGNRAERFEEETGARKRGFMSSVMMRKLLYTP